MDIIVNEAKLPQPPNKVLLRPHQIVQHQEDLRQCDADLRNANVQKKGDVVKRKRKLEAQYLDQAPQPITNGSLRDKVAKRINELKDKIRVGLPTAEEMRKATPQTVEQHRKWERLNKPLIKEWRNLERQLHTDTSDPDTHDRSLGDVETLRPMSAQDRLRTDGFITGKMSYGSVPQENWDAIFEEPQNTALKQARRAQVESEPQTPAPRPKRTLTPEQRAAAAANMAKARAARKLNLEKPSTAQVEQPQPTPVVEEVTE
jgi:hypothetical protein